MGNYALTGIQPTDGFAITPSNSLDIASDPGNKKGYKTCYVHVSGTSGLVQVTPADGNPGYSIATTLGSIVGGSGYNNGTFNGVTLTYAGGTVASNVVANVTVTSGAVSGVTYVSGGQNADTTTVYQYTGGQQGALGGGTGFTTTVTAVNAAASDIILVYAAQGTILGGTMPIPVRRVWVTGTAATSLVALVTKGN